MTFRVRTSNGELRFETERDIVQGLRAGTVSIEDQVLAPVSSEWRPVAELPAEPAGQRSLADYHWYILAAVLLAVLVVFGPTWPAALMVLGAISAHSVWMTMHRSGKAR